MDNHTPPERGQMAVDEKVLSRISARSAIEDKINRLRVEAHNLEALLYQLPLGLQSDADEALLNLVARR